MQKNRLMFTVIAVVLSISLLFVFGCSQKAAVKETSEEKQVVAEKQAPAQVESDAEREARERALREAQLREQERQRAEQERAAKKQAEEAAVASLEGFDFIYFDFDKYAVRPDARETLKKVADWLNANPDAKLVIEGNTDERGTVEYNLALGERRAKAAADYLVALGIDKDRLSIVSYGKEKPIDPGHNEEAWAKNRNAHFVIK